MSYLDDMIRKIAATKSLQQLDTISADYHSDVGTGSASYIRDIDLALHRRESELTLMAGKYSQETTDLIGKKPMVKVNIESVDDTEDNVVVFDLTRRKTPATEEAVDIDSILMLDVKCDCVIRHGVPCIHKSSFNGILPNGYHECAICGCDHTMDPRLSKEVHAKLGESI